jgi:hypothetical protein
MSAYSQYPNTHLSEAARDRAVAHLQACYASGQLNEADLDRRLDQALGARDRAELNRALVGLARIAPAPLRAPAPGLPSPADNVGAGMAHLSGLFTSFVGPAVIKAVATPGSRLWWESARALSLQVTMIVAGFAAMVASVVLGLTDFMGLVWLVWFAATLTASVRAFNGQSGTGRFERVLLARPQAPRGQLPQTRYHG